MSTPCKPASCRLGPVALFLLAISCSATDTPVEPTPATSSALKPAVASWVLRTPAGGASPFELPAWIAIRRSFRTASRARTTAHSASVQWRLTASGTFTLTGRAGNDRDLMAGYGNIRMSSTFPPLWRAAGDRPTCRRFEYAAQEEPASRLHAMTSIQRQVRWDARSACGPSSATNERRLTNGN